MKYKGITIHKSKKCNTWYTRYRINGKQYYLSAKTQKECYKKLKKTINNQIISTSNQNITFIEWYNKWYDLYKKNKVKEETIRNYNTQLKKIPNDLKNKDINEITNIEIIEMLNNVEKERARQKMFEFLKPIFDKAKLCKITKENIFNVIEKPKHIKQKGIALNYQEQNLFIQLCQNNKYGNLFLFMMWQGLRIGETLALNYSDIKDNKIIINKQLTKQGVVNYTKNRQSNRIIPLFNKTKKLINLNSNGRIFNITESTANKNLKILIKNQDLPQNLTTHDLRHTFITNCQNKGIPEYVIQALVGHELGSMVTKQIYTHFNLEDNLTYINKLND